MERDAHKGCIMILGAPNDNDGNLSLIAKLRLRQGKKELLLNPGFKILLTGGFGGHFNQTNHPHWQYAKDFLIKELLVSPDSFLPEAIESSNEILFRTLKKQRLYWKNTISERSYWLLLNSMCKEFNTSWQGS